MIPSPTPPGPAVFFRSPRPWSVRIGRNPSWAASLRLLLTRVLFYAPTHLLHDLKDTALLLATGLVMAPVMLLCVTVAFLACVVAGLLGFLRLPTEQELAEEISDAG